LEYHFVLRIEKIVMQSQWKHELEHGKRFPHLPVDYGFRDGVRFWFSDFSAPYHVDVPKNRKSSAENVQFIANRIDPQIKWEVEACEKLIKVPRVFLKRVLQGVVDYANERGIQVITAEVMEQINQERKKKG
jgi:hypothetical protein